MQVNCLDPIRHSVVVSCYDFDDGMKVMFEIGPVRNCSLKSTGNVVGRMNVIKSGGSWKSLLH